MTRRLAIVVMLVVLIASTVTAQVRRNEAVGLDAVAFKDANIGVKTRPVDLSVAESNVGLKTAWQQFFQRVGNRSQWNVVIDAYSGLPANVSGPGLRFGGVAQSKPTMATLETSARQFLSQNANIFLDLPSDRLTLNPTRSLYVDSDLAYVDFDVTVGGVPVEGSRIIFRINNGRVIQFGAEGVLPGRLGQLNSIPSIDAETARQIAFDYVGGFNPKSDSLIQEGRLTFLPRVQDASSSAVGENLDYPLVWEVAFVKKDQDGTWLAHVDAHSGQVIEFYNSNHYAGIVKGGVHELGPSVSVEVVMPMPFANTGLAAPNDYANSAGRHSGSGTATTTLNGKYIQMSDRCGAISLAGGGDLNLGTSGGTDCTTPGVGGAGNTHSSRSGFYHLNRIKEKGRAWLPSNTWLQGKLVANMNISSTCNANWNGSQINFFRSGGGCGNTGEISAIYLHEYGHGLDSNDGISSTDYGTGEAYGDTTAFLQTHDSCIGPGFLTAKCDGYGDACTTCTGVRDVDYGKHSSNAAHTVGSFVKNTCPAGGGYDGPCLKEGHCESAVISESVWDLAARRLTAAGYDAESAWYIVDRLFYLTRPTAGAGYSCNTSTYVASGCSASHWHSAFLAADDDDGNLANGTPHAAAIYQAFNSHGIACTTATQTNSTTCGAITSATPAGVSANVSVADQVTLSWSAVAGASSYVILRNDFGCSKGYTRIGTTTSTSYADGAVAGGFTYYYRVVAVGSSAACFSRVSACVTATPTSGGSTPTYSISGTITAGGTGLSGATVNYSGTASGSVATGTGGTFTISGLANGSYTLTPAKADYTFSPTSLSPTVSSANVTGQNFTGTFQSSDVQLTSGVGANSSVALQQWKYFYITVPAGATNLVIATTNATGDVDLYTQSGAKPTSAAYVCRPYQSSGNESCTQANPTAGTWWAGAYGYAAGSFTITATVTTASATYSISGTVSGATLSGVTITLSGAGSGSTTTDASGNYTFTGKANGSYTVTPSKTGFSFTPVNRSFSISNANVTGQNFTSTATSTTYSISGTVSGATASGVTMSLTGAATGSTTTDVSGNYSFAGLANGAYTVTPSKSGFTFSPVNRAVTISSANQTAQNFTATAVSGDTPLTSGVPVATSVALQAWKYFYISVPAGATNLTIGITGLSADVDLYTGSPSQGKPNSTTYTCRPYSSGTTAETCNQASPAAGTWWAGVYGYAAGNFSITATVTTGGGSCAAQTATYSATYGAPACTTAGISCNAGATLLNCAGSNEPSQPNTADACTDGSGARTCGSDETVNALKIETTDGTSCLATGKQVKATLTIRCWGTADTMALYYATSASSPSWTLVSSTACSGAGNFTWSPTFTLSGSAASTQAVRAQMRYNNATNTACTNATWDDVDDVVFKTQ